MDWTSVTRSMSSTSMPGPGLFTIYVNDLDEGIEHTVANLLMMQRISRLIHCEVDAKKPVKK